MKGWIGKTLIVDLNTGSIATEPLDAEIARQFIGGTWLARRSIRCRRKTC